MESNSDPAPNPDAARDALAAIGDDRERIGRLMTAETWWAAPAQGLGTAVLVAAPAAGLFWAIMIMAASTWIFLGIERLFRKRTGLSISRPAGPRGLVLVIGLGVLIVVGVGVSVALSLLGLQGWIFAVAAVAGILTALGVAAYDRIYAAEVRRAA